MKIKFNLYKIKKAYEIFFKYAFLFFCASLFFNAAADAQTRDDVKKLYKNGVDFLLEMNYDAAEATFRKIIESGYEFPEAYNNLGFAKMKQKKNDEAIFELKNALRLNPDFPDALNNLGLIYLEHPATVSMALQLLKKASGLSPENASYHDSLGLCYYKLGLLKESEIEFKTSNLLDKTIVSPIYNLGVLYDSAGKQFEAIECYNRVIARQKDHLMGNFKLFKLYMRREEKSLAANYLLNVFKILKNSKPDRYERIAVEEEILCNLKAFIVELAINFNVELKKLNLMDPAGEKSVSATEYLIAYEDFSKSKLFNFFESTELRCPQTGRYYTNYVNHVNCPAHGSLPLFTDKVYDIKEMRNKYQGNICAECRKMLEYSIFIKNISETDETKVINKETIDSLIEKGYLRDLPACPAGGNYSIGENGFVTCSAHGVTK